MLFLQPITAGISQMKNGRIYTKAIEICNNDEEWKSDWNDDVRKDVQNRIDNEFMEVFDNLIDSNNFSQEVRAIKDQWLHKK